MNIVIAMDSMKGSLSSVAAGSAAASGIRRVLPDATIRVFPAADGGEGTTEALVTGCGGTYRSVQVSDPLGRKIHAQYGILPDGTAVIEMAAASGLALLSSAERNPLHTTSAGFGEMIADAIRQGSRSLLLGIGGSATNDGGVGCLRALGFSFTDADGAEISSGAAGLSALRHIRCDAAMPVLADCDIRVACDVTNPLCGQNGCSVVFGPQKGADADMAWNMDDAMRHYAQTVTRTLPDSNPEFPGAGAAGGLGFALRSFLGAKLEPGIGLVMRKTGLAAAISDADFVITGEGCLDAQTVMGKVPAGIAGAARQSGRPVIAFCGVAGENARLCNDCGIDAFFPILRTVCTAEQAMQPDNAARNLADTAEQAFRLILAARGRA